VLHAGHALAATWSSDCHYDALDGPREARLIDPGTNFLLRELRIGERTRIPKVKIDDNVIFCRHFREARAHRVYRFVKSIVSSMSREDVDPPSVLHVFRRDRTLSLYRHQAKVCQ
jgi:hypothetical protein